MNTMGDLTSTRSQVVGLSRGFLLEQTPILRMEVSLAKGRCHHRDFCRSSQDLDILRMQALRMCRVKLWPMTTFMVGCEKHVSGANANRPKELK